MPWILKSIELSAHATSGLLPPCADSAKLMRRALRPKLDLRLIRLIRFRGSAPGPRGDDPTYLAQRERLIDGMRKAGVPEG